MITAIIEYEHKFITIRFPCTEAQLTSKLNELDFGYNIHNMLVHTFVEPIEFAPMENQVHDLDELNYLAKRMDSFVDSERRRFFAALTHENIYQVPDLINLTFNLNRYTVVQDVSAAFVIGRTYALDEMGCLPADDFADPKYDLLGRQLMESGTGILTRYGALFIHSDTEPEEVYDGQVFPEYDCNGDSTAAVVISYDGKSETLYLPDEQAAIQKSVKRLGADNIRDCEAEVFLLTNDDEHWQQILQTVIERESVFAVNYLLTHCFEQGADLEKLTAAIEHFNVSTTDNIVILAEHCDEFGLANDVHTTDEVGRYFVENDPDYPLHPEMEDYFDYEGFGEHLVGYLEGAFVTDGFLYYNGDDSMDDIAEQLAPEDVEMEMGGI